MQFEWKKLYRHLNDLRKECGESWREMGKKAHIPSSTFTRIKHGKPASVDNLIKIMVLFHEEDKIPLYIHRPFTHSKPKE